MTVTPAAPIAPDNAGLAPAALAASIGASVENDAFGVQAAWAAPLTKPQMAQGILCLLTDLGVLRVSGTEAAAFLQNQLTNDVLGLGLNEARWYGYCSPKGRLLSTSLGWQEPGGYALTVSRPQAVSLRQRLAMYVLRAKAKVEDVSDSQVLIGVGGVGAARALAGLGLSIPVPMAVTHHDGLVLAGLPAVSLPVSAQIDHQQPAEAVQFDRYLLCVPVERLTSIWASLAGSLHAASTGLWRYAEVLSGIPRVIAATTERFVPQMINFELVGGVNFKKGCYPGQEVVARSQYLGKLKRRMFLASIAGPAPDPGTDIQSQAAAPDAEAVGQVVLSAAAPDGVSWILFEARTDTDAGFRSADGRPLALQPLPYQVPGR